MRISLIEASEVWNVAHTICKHLESGAQAPGDGSGGNGDGKYVHHWCADIRKLARDNEDRLDEVYGDVPGNPTMRQIRNVYRLLKQFRDSLEMKQELYAEYPIIRQNFFG